MTVVASSTQGGAGVSIAATRSSLGLDQTVTVSTKVSPGHSGRAVYRKRLSGSTWATVATTTRSSTSTASAVVRPPLRGTNLYRWGIPDPDPDPGHSAAAQIRGY